MVFYETPHRIDQAMQDLQEVFGSDRLMALCRELTKEHEQIRRGTVGDIVRSLREDPARGEMVLVVAGASALEARRNDPEAMDDRQLADLARELAKSEGLRLKEAIARVTAEHPLADGSLPNRKRIYALAVEEDKED